MFRDQGNLTPRSGRHLAMIGLDCRSAEIAQRERFSVSGDAYSRYMGNVLSCPHVVGAALLSTCHRMELYLSTSEWLDRIRLAELFLQGRMDSTFMADDGLYVYRKLEVPRRLFQVSSGLCSAVLGEGQILRQVKQAYAQALAGAYTDAYMNRLFTSAIETGKSVRQTTGIGRGAMSIPQAAAQSARRYLGRLDGVGVLIIGAGSMAQKTARYLQKYGMSTVWVCNRSPEPAKHLAGQINGVVLPWEALRHPLEIDVRLVVSATSSPDWIVSVETLAPLAAKCRSVASGDTLCIDLAVPRDIEPSVGSVPGIRLLNVDDLRLAIIDQTERRHAEVSRALALVEEAVTVFEAWRRERRLVNSIAMLTQEFDAVYQQGIAELSTYLSPRTRVEMEQFSRKLINAALHRAVGTLKTAAVEIESNDPAEVRPPVTLPPNEPPDPADADIDPDLAVSSRLS